MIKQTTTVIALISAASLITAAYGCSSSTSGNGGGDAGLQDSGVVTNPTDSGSTSKDSGTSGEKDSSTSSSNDSGPPSDNDAGDSSTGPTCPGPVATTDLPTTYSSAATAPLGGCTAEQISEFAALCFGEGSSDAGTCGSFVADTANAGCLACALPGTPSQEKFSTGGAEIVNPTTGDPILNVYGCIVGQDKTQTTCATDFENYYQCGDVACSDCDDIQSDGPDYMACEQSTTPAPDCAQYNTAISTDCTSAADEADGGVYNTCNDAIGLLTYFCGGAASTADAGDGG